MEKAALLGLLVHLASGLQDKRDAPPRWATTMWIFVRLWRYGKTLLLWRFV